MHPPTSEPPSTDSSDVGVLLLRCADRPGLVAEVAGFIADHRGNIIDAQQHTDATTNQFFQRVTFQYGDMDLPPGELAAAFAPVASRLGMTAELHVGGYRPRWRCLPLARAIVYSTCSTDGRPASWSWSPWPW